MFDHSFASIAYGKCSDKASFSKISRKSLRCFIYLSRWNYQL